jgi:diguanylate cyclase (GGDEF)-like protein
MADVRIFGGVGGWLSRTLTRKFLLLMAGFLALQVVQLGTGIVEAPQIGAKAAAINEAGRQRMRTLLLGSLAQQAVTAGSWETHQFHLFREAMDAADLYFDGHGASSDRPRGEADAGPVERLRWQTRSDWRAVLRPLLLAAGQSAHAASARDAIARYHLIAGDKLLRLDQVVAAMEHEVRERSQSLAWAHGIILAVSLLLGLIGFAMARHLVTRPLRRLIGAAEAIAAGAYERRVPVSSRDELGELAATFNRMAVAVGEQTARLRALSQAAAAVTSTLALNDILDAVMRRAVGLSGVEAACIALRDPTTGTFKDRVTHGLSKDFARDMVFRPGGLAEQALTGSAPVLSDDRPGSRHPLSPLARAEGIRCLVCLPLLSRDNRLGVVFFYRDDRDAFTAGEIEDLRIFASLAAGAIANARLHEETLGMAITDKLTGLRNRRLFDQHLNDETARSRRDGRPLALLLADIDHFKRVNDTYGHAAGDQVLQSVSRSVAAASRQADLAARFGGEEFAVLLPDTDAEGARLVAERIRSSVAGGPVRLADGGDIAVTLSIGIAIGPQDGETPDRMLERADQALYSAKRAGRNRVFLYRETPKARLEGDPAQLQALLGRGAESIPEIITAFSAKARFYRGHSEAVAEAARRLGAALGLGADEREALGLAALLHDLGMIGIPDEILNRRGGLSETEWALVQSHAAAGAELLARVPALGHLAPIVRHHHERFDGSGYPDGLRGEAIPYLARVLAVADAYGTVAGGWVGRTPQSEAQALEMVRAGAGTAFDPRVAGALTAPPCLLEVGA